MELTEIVKQYFMVVPYVVISADSYPIPEGWPSRTTMSGSSRPDADTGFARRSRNITWMRKGVTRL